ncbi:hypothetical protein BH24ACT8_BH24ACT8_03670 [soil metagenome]
MPLLWHSGYYPSAVPLLVYGGLVLWGFFVWRRAARLEAPTARGPTAVRT